MPSHAGRSWERVLLKEMIQGNSVAKILHNVTSLPQSEGQFAQQRRVAEWESDFAPWKSMKEGRPPCSGERHSCNKNRKQERRRNCKRD